MNDDNREWQIKITILFFHTTKRMLSTLTHLHPFSTHDILMMTLFTHPIIKK